MIEPVPEQKEVTCVRNGHAIIATLVGMVFEDVVEVTNANTNPPTIKIKKGPFANVFEIKPHGSPATIFELPGNLKEVSDEVSAEMRAKEDAACEKWRITRGEQWGGNGPKVYTA